MPAIKDRGLTLSPNTPEQQLEKKIGKEQRLGIPTSYSTSRSRGGRYLFRVGDLVGKYRDAGAKDSLHLLVVRP